LRFRNTTLAFVQTQKSETIFKNISKKIIIPTHDVTQQQQGFRFYVDHQ
jgi:hypothetical protein